MKGFIYLLLRHLKPKLFERDACGEPKALDIPAQLKVRSRRPVATGVATERSEE
jgi:hypothetical protein